jgi:hypothetical protein
MGDDIFGIRRAPVTVSSTFVKKKVPVHSRTASNNHNNSNSKQHSLYRLKQKLFKTICSLSGTSSCLTSLNAPKSMYFEI